MHAKVMKKIFRKRDQSNHKEEAIHLWTEKIVLQENWARNAFEQVTSLQLIAMKSIIKNIDDHEVIYKISKQTFEEVSKQWKTHFADKESEDAIKNLSKDKSILITTNHLGLYHLCGIETKEVGIEIEGYQYMFPFWGYIAGLYPISKIVNQDLSLVSAKFPGIFHEIHTSAGFIHVPPKNESGGAVEEIKKQISNKSKASYVYFPEGITSGKQNESDPYHLAPFKKGAYAIAHDLQLTRVLAAQFFHPKNGLEIKVLDVKNIACSENSFEVCSEFALSDHSIMQKWLDKRLEIVYPGIVRMRNK